MFGKKKKAAVDLSALTAQVAALSSQMSGLAEPYAAKAKPYAGKLGQVAKEASGVLLQRAEAARPSVEQVVSAATLALAPKLTAARTAALVAAVPLVEAAREHATDAAHDLAPYVETARERVTDAVVAGLAASAPYREEATRRGTAAVAALKGEIEVKPNHHWGRKFLLATGLAGLVFAGYKYLTGESSTSGWQTPTSAPAPSPANTTTGAHAGAAATETIPTTDSALVDDLSAPADAKPLGDAELAEDSRDATLTIDGEKSQD